MKSLINHYLQEHALALELVRQNLEGELQRAAAAILAGLKINRKILTMGNGGSAADAQHLCAELVGRFRSEKRPLPAIDLSSNVPVLTALANDFGFEDIFRRQILAFASPGDLVIGISTSGRSANILNGLQTAKTCGCTTIALLGNDGGAIAEHVDIPIIVPVTATSHIQEMHITILHLLCMLVDREFSAQN